MSKISAKIGIGKTAKIILSGFIFLVLLNYSLHAAVICTPQSAVICAAVDDIADIYVNGIYLGTFGYVDMSMTGQASPTCMSLNTAQLTPLNLVPTGNILAVHDQNTGCCEMWATWSMDITCQGGAHSYVESDSGDGIDYFEDANACCNPTPVPVGTEISCDLGPNDGTYTWTDPNYTESGWSPASGIVYTGIGYGQKTDSFQFNNVMPPLGFGGIAAGCQQIFFRQAFNLNEMPTPAPPNLTITETSDKTFVTGPNDIVSFSLHICNTGGGTTNPVATVDSWTDTMSAWQYQGPWGILSGSSNGFYYGNISGGAANGPPAVPIIFDNGFPGVTCTGCNTPCYDYTWMLESWNIASCVGWYNSVTLTWQTGSASSGTEIDNFCPTYIPTVTQTITLTCTYTPNMDTPTQTPTITPVLDCVFYHIDRSAVPAMVFMPKLTLLANIGDCDSCTVYVDGVPVSSTYTASTRVVMFTAYGTDIIISRSNYIGNATYAITKATLYNNKKWAYSFTFDDCRPTTRTVVLPMFQTYGYIGGSALNTGNMAPTTDGYGMSWASADILRAAGWSFFDHTVNHDNVTCSNISTQVLPVKSAIEARWPGYLCTEFVYPYCDTTYWTCIANSGLFLSAESCPGNNYADIVPPNPYILNRNILCAAGNLTTTALANAAADNAANDTRSRWLINFTHYVEPGNGTPPTTYDTNEATLGAHIAYVYNTYGEGGLNNMWFAPTDEVMQYILTRTNAVVSFLSTGQCGIIMPASPTNTPVNTMTSTPVLPTATFTKTPIISPTITETATATAAQTAAAGRFAITDTVIFPNPYNPEKNYYFNIKIDLAKPASQLKIRIYTAAFRRVMEECEDGLFSGLYTSTLPWWKFSNLSPGMYYLVILGESTSGEKAISNPVELIILK